MLTYLLPLAIDQARILKVQAQKILNIYIPWGWVTIMMQITTERQQGLKYHYNEGNIQIQILDTTKTKKDTFRNWR